MMGKNNTPYRRRRISIGVLFNKTSAPNQEKIIAGIDAYARDSDINLFCFDAGACENNSKKKKSINNLFCGLINKRTIDGLIIVTGALQAETKRAQGQIYKRFQPLPIVTIGFTLKGSPSVFSDCKKGMQTVIEHLVKIHGYKKIAFITGPDDHPLAKERLNKYIAALERLTMPVNTRLIIEGNFTIDSGRKAVASLFDGKKPACDVILASNDTMAVGVLEELIKRGVRVPADCAVAGFQDEEIAEYAPLPLTTLYVPHNETGREAAEILSKLIRGEEVTAKTFLPTELIIRESCGCFPIPAPLIRSEQNIDRHCPSALDASLVEEYLRILLNFHPEFLEENRGEIESAIRRVLETLSEASDRFIAAWTALLNTLISLKYELEPWIETLSILRIQTLKQFSEPEKRGKIEEMFLQAFLQTTEKIKRLSVYHRFLMPERMLALRNIEEKLLTSSSLAMITETIAEDFQDLEIPSCFFSLWDGKDTPLHYSTLAVAYENYALLDVRKYGHPYITNRLLPPDMMNEKNRTTLFIEALFKEDSLLGLFLFEDEKPDLSMHEVLRKSLTKALNNSLYVQEVRDFRSILESQLSTQTKDLLERNQKLHREKRAYEKLKDELGRSEARYKKWFEDDFTGNFIAAATGDIVNCNSAFAKIFGFSSVSDALGANFGDFYPNKSALEDFYTLLHVVKQIEYYESEFVRKDGSTVHIIGNILGTFDEDNNLIEMQGFLFDNTERKRLEEELRQSHKMDAIGRLAGGIAHDFNNILTGIMGYSELLLHKIPKSDPSQRDVEEIKKAAKSAASLTRQLLAFSRKQILKPLLLDLNEVVRTMGDLLHRIIGEHITLITSLDPDLAPVKADRGQIEQVIMNLVINSRDALVHGGTVVVTTRNKVIDSTPDLNATVDIKPGAYVVLEVSDNGIGMDLETQSHVFEPFFTTKKPGQGVGLGLSTVYGIITQSGGIPEVLSEPHRGTTMRIYLPQHTSTTEVREAPLQYQEDVKGTETILLVEDEDFVRELAEKLLSHDGYHVIAAHNGQEAMSLIKKHTLTFDLLVTDIIMPGISGVELGRKIQAMRPEIKVLYMSGYDDKMLAQQGEYGISLNFIQKPFTPELFLRTVQEVLNQ
jgi:PAS domain S-box-containing protein